MVDRDIIMLQLAAANMPSDDFLINVVRIFMVLFKGYGMFISNLHKLRRIDNSAMVDVRTTIDVDSLVMEEQYHFFLKLLKDYIDLQQSSITRFQF